MPTTVADPGPDPGDKCISAPEAAASVATGSRRAMYVAVPSSRRDEETT